MKLPGYKYRSKSRGMAIYDIVADVDGYDAGGPSGIWSSYAIGDNEELPDEAVQARIDMAVLSIEHMAKIDAMEMANDRKKPVTLTLVWRDIDKTLVVSAKPGEKL